MHHGKHIKTNLEGLCLSVLIDETFSFETRPIVSRHVAVEVVNHTFPTGITSLTMTVMEGAVVVANTFVFERVSSHSNAVA